MNKQLFVSALAGLLLAGCVSWPQQGPTRRPPPPPNPWPAPEQQAGQQTGTQPDSQPIQQPQQPWPQQPDSGSTAGSAETQPPVEPAPQRPQAPVRPARKPATIALANQAQQQRDAGQLAESASTIERAMRIEPRDAGLWYQLADVRIEQGKSKQAEALLRKSNALAVNDADQQARNWRLIAKARLAQGDRSGAGDALRKARELES